MAPAAAATEPQAVAACPPASLPGNACAVDADLDMKVFLEYQKLAQFRDTILTGKHPTIKLPVPTSKIPTAPRAHAANNRAHGQNAKQSRQTCSGRRGDKARSSINGVGAQAVAVAAASTQSMPPASEFPATTGNGVPELDPIFLEKSEDLIRAELRVQRQRLEKSLREELEQHKASTKATAQEPESLLEFNLSEVLVKALTLVQATSAPCVPDADGAGDDTESSDSFDNNTFYSSQHDTPEPHDTSVRQDSVPAALEEDMTESLQDDPYSPTQNLVLPPAPARIMPASGQATVLSYPPGLGTIVPKAATSDRNFPPQHNGPRLIHASDRTIAHEVQYVNSGDSGANGRVDDFGNNESDQAANLLQPRSARYHMSDADARRQPSPLIRAHDLSPYAPQPAHVSQLTFGAQSSILEPDAPVLQVAPAPIAALRHQESAATSPESSSPNDQRSKRKERKERRKERKKQKVRSRRDVGSPEIKPEPQSPSPISVPNMARPAKRQKSDHTQQEVLIVEAPTSVRPVSQIFPAHHFTESMQVERAAPYVWERPEDPLARSGRSSAVPSVYRPEQPQLFERRYDDPGAQYVRRVYTPTGQPPQYLTSEARPLRSATYSIAQPEYREVPAYTQAGRAATRSYPDRARSRSPVVLEHHSPTMAPPGPSVQPQRIVVDQYGREYFEPPPRPVSVIRHSAVPAPRPREQEIMYERGPARAISRVPAEPTFEENGIIYRRVSPVYGGRRVVTQPEYARSEYVKSYRDRDYSTQPAALPREEYVEYRTLPERRVQEETVPGNYFPRPISVRPQEGVQYYSDARVPSVHSEAPLRQYTASVHPDARRERLPTTSRQPPQHQSSLAQEYDPRSAGQDLPPPVPPQPLMQQQPPRPYSVRPVEYHYYEQQPLRVEKQLAYGQVPQTRPIPPGEVVYIDDPARPAYR